METIERIRNATFTLARRGYDRREVDNYLSKLAEWLEGGGADQVHSDTVKHELERTWSPPPPSSHSASFDR